MKWFANHLLSAQVVVIKELIEAFLDDVDWSLEQDEETIERMKHLQLHLTPLQRHNSNTVPKQCSKTKLV